jgi:DNA-binding SARP family transcriptional activator
MGQPTDHPPVRRQSTHDAPPPPEDPVSAYRRALDPHNGGTVRPGDVGSPVASEGSRIVVCLFGGFRLLKGGVPISPHGGPKSDALLAALALRAEHGVPREVLVSTIWPDADSTLANQSLNSLVHSLTRLLRDATRHTRPILYADGSYRLNVEAGIDVDVQLFQDLAAAGDRCVRAGDEQAAVLLYTRAVDLYQGDLRAGSDVSALIERERLRALRLTLLAKLADAHYLAGEYRLALDRAHCLLTNDPSREDAHRLAMLCYARLGERAQALRQYLLCEIALRDEFDAKPEPATRELFDALRLRPDTV